MRHKAPVLVACLLAQAASIVASGKDPDPTEELQKLNPAIETVVSGGHWERGEQEGSFRLILTLEGWEHISNRAFLQWLRTDQESHEIVVEKTIPIEEINSGAWRAGAAKLVLAGNEWRIVVPAESTFEDRKTVFTITPSAEFKYKLSQAKK